MRINTDSQKLRADYLALTEAERDAQDPLKTQQKELQENITALYETLYLAEHDTYTAN